MGAFGSAAFELCGIVKGRIRVFEEQPKVNFDSKHDVLKSRTPATISYNYVSGKLTCPYCAREFVEKIGYISHSRAHHQYLRIFT